MKIHNLIDINYLYFILLFVIPGFIINYIQRMFRPEKYEFEFLAFLQFFVYSLIYDAIFIPILKCFACPNFLWLYWMILLFIVPAIVGIFVVVIHPKQLLENLFKKMNIDIKFQTKTAWDNVFYDLQCKIEKKKRPFLIIVTLNDESQISGLYGTSSKTSYGLENSDIFIEKVLTLDDNDNYDELEGQAGIIIKGNQIKHIEFIELEEEEEQHSI